MLSVAYRRAALLASQWTTADVRWLAVTTDYAPDVDTDEFVAAVTSWELTGAGYARWVATGRVASFDGATLVLDCDDPQFGVVAAGETIGWAIAYRHVTDDTDSELICALRVEFATDGATPVTVVISDRGVLRFADARHRRLEPGWA